MAGLVCTCVRPGEVVTIEFNKYMLDGTTKEYIIAEQST